LRLFVGDDYGDYMFEVSEGEEDGEDDAEHDNYPMGEGFPTKINSEAFYVEDMIEAWESWQEWDERAPTDQGSAAGKEYERKKEKKEAPQLAGADQFTSEDSDNERPADAHEEEDRDFWASVDRDRWSVQTFSTHCSWPFLTMPTQEVPGAGWDAAWWALQIGDTDMAMTILLCDFMENITAWYYATWLPYCAKTAAYPEYYETKAPEPDYTRDAFPCFQRVWFKLKTHLYNHCPKPDWEWEGGPFPRQLEHSEHPGEPPLPLCPFLVSWDTTRPPPNHILAGGCPQCFGLAEYRHNPPPPPTPPPGVFFQKK